MTVWEVFAEYDKNATIMNDQELEVWLNETLSAFQQEHPDDYFGQSAILNELGGFYRSRGIFDKGEQAFLLAKNLHESIQDFTSLDYATTLNNLAGIYRLAGDLDRALEMFNEAQKLYETSEKKAPPELYASCLNNKGLVYQDMKRYEEARELFEKALALINDLPNNGYVLATTLSNLAFALHGLGEKDKVALYLDQAIEIFCQEMGEQSPLYQSCLKVREKLLGE